MSLVNCGIVSRDAKGYLFMTTVARSLSPKHPVGMPGRDEWGSRHQCSQVAKMTTLEAHVPVAAGRMHGGAPSPDPSLS